MVTPAILLIFIKCFYFDEMVAILQQVRISFFSPVLNGEGEVPALSRVLYDLTVRTWLMPYLSDSAR